ncbi:2-methylisoborneol synthase [Actinoplanes octamycinicus]|uniref:2-methylisoborneol synthase n=1 Tax=Actinoplanes octamycinicus TaxID=135948 RepID=A0A7W7GXG0_9ACTN|nr:family 2 encapsulin nanocompartment cargo protein terpene cyclase [Actinoplanes octamycinicus]MBB4740094.1 2-methylisoborneol synthase [Actinoplanes octamycinicus]GIE59490.1 terpene synthase [Actinoplanes octamycinicus]
MLLADLGREILRDLSGAPPADLAAVLTAVPKTVGLKPSGLGTSAARAFLPPPQPTAEPRLFCPGPVRDDPALGEQVNEAVVRWAAEAGIYPGRLEKLRAANFGRLVMLTHPATDDPDRLLAATKCLVAEWAADDYYVDEVALGADPAVVGSRLANLYAVVDPPGLPRAYAGDLTRHHRARPISVAFRGALDHLSRYTTAAQFGRFQHQLAIQSLGWGQEADWHANRRTPRVWEYLVQRHLNSFLPPMLLIDVLAGYVVPPDEFHDPRTRRAFTTAGTAAVLVNDLYSASNESDNDHNLPSVLVATEGLSHRDAVLRTVEIHNELMTDFVTAAAALGATGSPQLRRFLADTWAWLGGSREWHATSGRYHSSDSGGILC